MPIRRSLQDRILKAPNSFTTSFPTTLANLGSPFTIGDNTGQNSLTGPQTTGGSPGLCYAHAGDSVDYLAFLQGLFTPTKHWAQWVCKRTPGYTAPSTQEVSLYLAGTLGSGISSGYECNFWFGGSTLQMVRWNNGATGSYDFSAVTGVSGAWPGSLSDGDVITAHFDSSSGSPVITIDLNATAGIVVFTDITAGKILSGGTGIGFFANAGAGGYDPTGYCAKGFSAGNG